MPVIMLHLLDSAAPPGWIGFFSTVEVRRHLRHRGQALSGRTLLIGTRCLMVTTHLYGNKELKR